LPFDWKFLPVIFHFLIELWLKLALWSKTARLYLLSSLGCACPREAGETRVACSRGSGKVIE
jgi:hypothetical protein